MAKNKNNLTTARDAKNDEFYTRLEDIENELRHYKEYFKGKTVFCNCDDPYESNFFKYFALNFNALCLKKLIAISYAGSQVVAKEVSLFEEEGEEYTITSKKAYKVTMTELKDVTGDGRVDLDDVREIVKHRIRYLKGNGGFDSEESIELLKEADIVITNPPFSRFRDYVAQLIAYDKKFIVLGNQNAISYKEIFPLIKDNRMWLGYKCGDMSFKVPDYYEPRETRYWQDETGQKWRSLGNICWYTNLDHSKRHEQLDLYKRYNPKEYPHYENYNAIEVSKAADIPVDYDGIMGVPITFLDKYCPEQFEVLGLSSYIGCDTLDFFNRAPENIQKQLVGGNAWMPILHNDNGYKYSYRRIFIRRKKAEE